MAQYKFLGMTFGSADAQEIKVSSQARFDACSNSIIFENDLTKPVVLDYFQRNGYVLFGLGGTDNLAPQIFSKLYYRSSLHRRICDFKIDLIQGEGVYFKWTSNEKPGTLQAGKERALQAEFDRVLTKYKKQFASDLTIHNRMYMHLCFHKDGESKGQIKSMKRIMPTMIRHSEGTIDGEIYTVTINKYFDRGSVEEKKLPTWRPNIVASGVYECVYMWQGLTDGMHTYALPSYIGANNWIDLDGNISEYHRSYLNNSVNPSLILSYPVELTPENRENLRQGMSKKKGGPGAGTVMVVQAPSKDEMPEITTINGSSNSEAFLHTSEQLQTNICFSHGINPTVLGMKVNSSLGSGKELVQAATIFSDDVVGPMKLEYAEFWNGLVNAIGLTGALMYGEKSLEGEVVKDVAEDKEAEARAALRGSVGGVQALLGVQAAVAAGTTSRDAAIAILELIFGFSKDEAERVIGPEVAAPVVVPGAPASTSAPAASTPGASDAPVAMDQPVANDHIKNLSGRQMMGLMRILKKYDDGKLTKAQALLMIKAFGLNDEEANTFLGDDEINTTE